jgi:hypothetical protein
MELDWGGVDLSGSGGSGDTFSAMYRALSLWVPDLPIFLAQQFVRDRYRNVTTSRPWASLRANGEIIINTMKSGGTVTTVQGSTSITGLGTAFASTDIGRQFLTGSKAPIYTITNVVGQVLTLDRAYASTSGAGVTYRILDAYATMPSDFARFIVVSDPQNNWRIRHWLTLHDLYRIDPSRITYGTPWGLFDRAYAPDGISPQYELWPYCHSARTYPYYYIRKATDLVNDTDTPITGITGDLITKGALMDVCRWPGTIDRPNPLFAKSRDLYLTFKAEYEDLLINAERLDEETYLTWLAEAEWTTWPYAPMDAASLQKRSW